MNPLRQVVKYAMTNLLPRQKWMVQGPRSASGIALTFDDGPHPEHTPRLLDELQRQNIVATFFVVGQAVERNPKLVQRMVAEGHAVGTHSYTHSEPRLTSAKMLREEVLRSLDLCGNLIGYEPTLFRPPKGQLTLTKTLSLWRLKQTIVLWNQDPRDYQAGHEGIKPWVNRYRPVAGDIVLLHDIHPHCIAAIEPIAQRVLSHNWGPFVRIDDWLSTHINSASEVKNSELAKQNSGLKPRISQI